MKLLKYIQYCFLFSIILSLPSCLFEDDDIFNESAAQRLNNAKKNTKETLLAAPNGWLMEYFATSTSSGYTLFIKFEDDGIATIGAQNEYFPDFTTDYGTFDVIGDNGPVLTFNSYNEVLHMFSNPVDPNGVGLNGDYEFIIMSVSDDMLKLKGKKRGTEIYLKKFTTEETWESYADKLQDMDNFLFNASVPKLSFHAGNERYIAYDGSSHIFSLLLEGDDEIVGDRTIVPFIVTTTGVRLYGDFVSKDGSLEARNFVLNSDKSALVAENSNEVIITGPAANSFFTDSLNWVSSKNWRLDKENLGGEFATVYNTIVENTKTIIGIDFEYFYFVYKGARKGRTLSFKAGRFEGAFDFSVPVVSNDNQISFNYKGSADNNGTSFLTRVAGIDRFLEMISDDNFTAIADSPLRPTVIKFVSNKNQNDWFKVILM